MKRLCLGSRKTKRGVASFYVVIFATILFGVMTLGFMRIILSESSQSSDDDLSRSAYDAAMMGVEDAKTAVNRYYECLRTSNSANCQGSLIFDDDCTNGIGIANYLYAGNYDGGEVVIQQGVASGEADDGTGQAYTCVIVRDTVPDYRGVLSSDTRTKVIPLAIYDENGNSSKISTVKKIRFSWYSVLNEGDKSALDFADGSNTFGVLATTPPTITLSFIRVSNNTQIATLHSANGDDYGSYNYATFALLPVRSDGSVNTVINSGEIVKNGNVTGDTKIPRTPVNVNCNERATDFVCAVDLDVSGLSFSNSDSVFLVASMPYGDVTTDFMAAMYEETDDKPVDFVGVQVSVDSTGRTSDLVRRVETRLDPADLYFPYPQFEVTMDGTGDGSISKNFWITANCWYNQPRNGGGDKCPNNGDVSVW